MMTQRHAPFQQLSNAVEAEENRRLDQMLDAMARIFIFSVLLFEAISDLCGCFRSPRQNPDHATQIQPKRAELTGSDNQQNANEQRNAS